MTAQDAQAGERVSRSGPPSPPDSPAQLAAMISLLSDDNPEVVARCRQALRARADRAAPLLAERLASLQPGAAPREERVLRRLLADLSADASEVRVRELLAHPERVELEAGAILVGQLVDGAGTGDAVTAALDGWAASIAAELGDDTDVDRRLHVLRAALVRRIELVGALPHGADLLDAVLAGVTSRKRGMPLPLCMTWILLARRLGLPLVGVNMPGHFLLRLDVPDRLLILDPFHGGAPLDLDVCRRYLVAQGLPSGDLLALDASDVDMLVRTLRNIQHLARRHGEQELALRCTRLLRPFTPS